MRSPAPWSLLLLAVGCAFPTDQSAEVFVTIDAPASVVVRGQTLVLRGAAWQRPSAGGPVRLAGATLDWAVDNPAVASIDGRDDGSAVVTGINSGSVVVRVRAQDYARADSATVEIRVTNTVAIDSVRPDTVRYGGQIVAFGVGLGLVDQMSLGETNLIPDPAGLSGDPAGVGSRRYWVPYPAATGHLAATIAGGFSAPAPDSTVVIPRTIYFTGDSSPAVVRLANTGPPGAVLFENPALAVAPDEGGNLIKFVPDDTTRGLTFSVVTTVPVVTGMIPTFSWAIAPDAPSFWSIGVSDQNCRGATVVTNPGLDFGRRPATVVRSFQHVRPGGVVLRVDGRSAGRFGVTVWDGYHGSDLRIQPDRFEENDSCVGADSNAVHAGTAVDVEAGLVDTLTIDQPYEADWFRFTIPGDPLAEDVAPLLVTARVASRPFSAADSSALGLGLVSVGEIASAPFEHRDAQWIAESSAPASSATVSTELLPGDYYLVVSDRAGVATRYGLCVGVGSTCVLPAAARGP
jgi:hypothetical protein